MPCVKVPGYDYGSPVSATSPVSRKELREIEQTIGSGTKLGGISCTPTLMTEQIFIGVEGLLQDPLEQILI